MHDPLTLTKEQKICRLSLPKRERQRYYHECIIANIESFYRGRSIIKSDRLRVIVRKIGLWVIFFYIVYILNKVGFGEGEFVSMRDGGYIDDHRGFLESLLLLPLLFIASTPIFIATFTYHYLLGKFLLSDIHSFQDGLHKAMGEHEYSSRVYLSRELLRSVYGR